MKSCKVHNVCLNQDVSEYLPKTSLFPKEMHETTLKTVKKRSVKLAKMPWHQLGVVTDAKGSMDPIPV